MSILFTGINILVQAYQNIFKTNRHIITNQIYFVVYITRQILNIQRIRTTLLENWDRPIFLMKSGLNILTIRTILLDNWDNLVWQLEPLPLDGWGKVGVWQNVPRPKLSYTRAPSTNLVTLGLSQQTSGGLARYCVHTTATWDQFWNIIKKVRNHSDGVSLVSRWLIKYRSYKKSSLEHHTLRITLHTSHII